MPEAGCNLRTGSAISCSFVHTLAASADAARAALAVLLMGTSSALVLANGPRSSKLPVPRSVTSGAQMNVVADVSAARGRRLTIAGASSRVAAANASRIRWRWRVPRAAHPGRYGIRVACGGLVRRATVRVRVLASGRRAKLRRLASPPIRAERERAVASGRSPLRFGVHSPPAPEAGSEPIDALERVLGRRISIVLWYQQWAGWGPEVEPEWIAGASAGGRLPLLTWEPWRPEGTEQPQFQLSRIAAGDFDDYVLRWARGLRNLGTTVYLRPMHEMNGSWYPWAGTVNGNSPENYRRAWRHLHDLFLHVGATNVRWVWSPNADDVPSTGDNAFEHYYPGDEYVDVLALDGYNWGAALPNHGGWRSFEQVFAAAYERLERLGSQPIWIAETASDAAGGDKAAWIRDMFTAATRMPRLDAIVWFHVDKERDWRATMPLGSGGAFTVPPV